MKSKPSAFVAMGEVFAAYMRTRTPDECDAFATLLGKDRRPRLACPDAAVSAIRQPPGERCAEVAPRLCKGIEDARGR